MVNNIQDLFLKYKSKLVSKKDIETKVLDFLKENFDLNLEIKNLKIDLKNKTIQIINLQSSLNFFLKTKITEKDKELIKEKTGFTFKN